MELALLIAVTEAASAPTLFEQRQQFVNCSPVRLVVALQHLVEEDPEALVHRRLLRNPEDARELVAQRAGAVGLNVGGAQHKPFAASR